MAKKAIELQFNWIFILIAGALILAFFFSVVQKQRTLSEQKLSLTLSSQMDAVFTGAIESKGTTQPLATPKPGIAFSCSNVCECKFYIGSQSNSFGDKLLFAPALLKNQDARAWAVEWKLPFRIANFLMLTNPEIKYYFVYESTDQKSAQLFQKIKKAVPAEINAEAVSTISGAYSARPQGYAHTRFVFIGTQEPSLQSLSNEFAEEDVSGVWIDSDMQKVVFYEKADANELEFHEYQSSLAGDVTAYASIFAADHLMYNCVMQEAFAKLGIIAEVHAKRAKALQSEMESPAQPRLECSGAYASIVPELENVAQKASLLGTAFPEKDGSALGQVVGAQSRLQQNNQNIILQSCPELY